MVCRKQCVHSFTVFDFLKETVSKVPDLGGSDAGGDDRSSKRRKSADEGNESDEESKRNKTQEVAAGQSSCCSVVRGRGRGRGRGRPRGSGRGAERDGARSDRFEDDPDTSPQHDNNDKPRDLKFSEEDLDVREQKETGACNRSHTGTVVRNFDLNLDWDENGDMSAAAAAVSTVITAEAAVASSSAEYGMKHEEYPGLPLSDMDKMAINPLLNGRLYEEDEDYDNEEGWVFE